MYLANIILRQETYFPATTKGGELTFKELDDNQINLMKECQAINNPVNMGVWLIGTIYNFGDTCRYNNKGFKWVDVTSAAGVVPESVAATGKWLEQPIGSLMFVPYNFLFSNADLTAGKIIITHNFNTLNVNVIVRDPNRKREIISDKLIDINTVELDFGDEISPGTWRCLISRQ